LQFNTNLK